MQTFSVLRFAKFTLSCGGGGIGLDPWLNLECTDLRENVFLLYAKSYFLVFFAIKSWIK